MKTINEVYAGRSLAEIEAVLRVLGGLVEQARVQGKSIDKDDRIALADAREAADRFGLSRQMQATIENEGAEIIREALR